MIAGWLCALVVLGATPKELIRLTVTVNDHAVDLVLRERETLLQAAVNLCDSDKVGLDKEIQPFERDKCVVDAVTIMGSQLGVPVSERSIGPALFNTTGVGTVGHYDPHTTGGSAKMHVAIEVPIQVDNGDAENTTQELKLRVAPWTTATEAATNVARRYHQHSDLPSMRKLTNYPIRYSLGFWKAADLNLIKNKIGLEATRKSNPIDPRLRQAEEATVAGSPRAVVSFDEYYPRYFVLHWPTLIFDWNRVKVAGAFLPPHDGEVCIRVDLKVNVLKKKAEQLTTCFGESDVITFSNFTDIDPQYRHRLTAYMKSKNGQVIGEGDSAEFSVSPPLLPEHWGVKQSSVVTSFLNLLKGAVSGWIYMDGGSDDPNTATPGNKGWKVGHTMIGNIRLNALEVLVQRMVTQNVPGDFLEAGTWRGGATIFMKGVLRAMSVDMAASEGRVAGRYSEMMRIVR
jgi:hypothetical protein